MNRLLKHIKKYKKEAILGPLFKLFEVCLELLIPFIVKDIIDKGINQGLGSTYVIKMVLLMILLGLCGLVCAITAQYFSAKCACFVSRDLREEMFDKMQSFSFKEIDSIGSSKMINQITNDVNQVQNGINLFLRLFLRSPFVVIGATIASFIISYKAGLVFLVASPILFVIIYYISKYTRKKYKSVQGNLDDLVKSTKENVLGVRVIRAFSNESDEESNFNQTLNKLNKSQKNASIISVLLNPITYLIINLAIILIIYIAYKEFYRGNLLQGDVIALYDFLGLILVELIKFANLVVTISKALVSLSRINDTLDINVSLVLTNDDKVYTDKYLQFSNVSFKYQNQVGYALDSINFSCEKGEVIGIIGGTGSGKTTLVNLIGHFYDVSSGNIYLEGKNINSYDVHKLRDRIGYVSQKSVLFKGTILENLRWKKKDADLSEVCDALEIAQGLDIISKKQNGLDEMITEGGNNLSGGQKQRLSIARALVGESDILIFDDSSSALDYLTDKKLREALKKLKTNPLIFIISQRTSSIMHADKIIVLDSGKMVAIGKHEELLTNCSLYKEIYDSQFVKGGKING